MKGANRKRAEQTGLSHLLFNIKKNPVSNHGFPSGERTKTDNRKTWRDSQQRSLSVGHRVGLKALLKWTWGSWAKKGGCTEPSFMGLVWLWPWLG